MTREQLEALLGDLSAVQVGFWIVAAILLIAAIVRLWPWITKSIKTIDALAGLPDFMRRTEQFMKRTEARVEEIHHEVQFNNGSSVKDAVKRVETGMVGLHTKLDAHLLEAADRDKRIDDIEDTLSS